VIQVVSSPYDVALLFAEQIDPMSATIKARIVLPPARAKTLAGAILRQLSRWEDRFGPVVDHDDEALPDDSATDTKEQ
jgi:hypothetical protein